MNFKQPRYSKPRTVSRPKRTTSAEAEAVRLRVEGKSQRAISEATGLPLRTVQRTLQEHRARIAQTAAQIFDAALEQVEPLLPKVIKRVNEAAESGTAKDLDAASRAALNVGKLVSTATGADEPGARGGRLTVEIVMPDWSKPRLRQVEGRVLERFLPPDVAEVSWPPRDHPQDAGRLAQPAIEAHQGDPEDPDGELKRKRAR